MSQNTCQSLTDIFNFTAMNLAVCDFLPSYDSYIMVLVAKFCGFQACTSAPTAPWSSSTRLQSTIPAPAGPPSTTRPSLRPMARRTSWPPRRMPPWAWSGLKYFVRGVTHIWGMSLMMDPAPLGSDIALTVLH